MDEKIRKNLETKGWLIGSAKDFLKLSDEEIQLVDFRILLGKLLSEKRTAKGYTQSVLADEIGSNPSRVERMEIGDNSVSIDLILKSLFHLGTSKEEICNYLTQK